MQIKCQWKSVKIMKKSSLIWLYFLNKDQIYKVNELPSFFLMILYLPNELKKIDITTKRFQVKLDWIAHSWNGNFNKRNNANDFWMKNQESDESEHMKLRTVNINDLGLFFLVNSTERSTNVKALQRKRAN